jgi:lysine 2,3-aminomutase
MVRSDPSLDHAHATLAEPDWRRLPGFRNVTLVTWQDARWQRRNSVSTVDGLKRAFGRSLPDDLAAEIAADQKKHATMGLRIPPHALNTMNEDDLWGDPVRRYMAPARRDRHPRWPNHPRARRDSLRETESWTVEGLAHRYPRKVMLELTTTCPQYCGHCTRMDLVGPSTSLFSKRSFELRQPERYEQMLAYLRAHSEIHDVVVSGGDVANVPIARLEAFVSELLEIPHVRSIRLASKSLVTLPQYYLDPTVVSTMAKLSSVARQRKVDLSLHTHANHANQVTELVGRATSQLLELGFRDVRNQGVLMRGVNATPTALLQLCERLLDEARIMPYYFYVCDMIPNGEHWRTSIAEAQSLQRSLMGRLPGFAIPRVICDVPSVGKRLIDQAASYDRERGISQWMRDPGTHRGAPADADAAVAEEFPYFDPIDTLPPSGREWWGATGKLRAM